MINEIIHGNAVEVLRTFENGCIDMTITSPPYDNIRRYQGNVKDGVEYEGGFSFPFFDIARELYRVTKKGGVVVWVVGDQVKNGGETGSSFRQALGFQEVGFKIYDTMIYQKNSASFPETGRYSQSFEYMFVLSKGKPKTVNLLRDKPNRWAGSQNFGKTSQKDEDGNITQGGSFIVSDYGTRTNIWYVVNGYGYNTKDTYAHQHPAIFPESMIEDHILSWSNEGDIVLDPMCGSGTTLKMAKVNNRRYVGIDIVEDYVELSHRRVNDGKPYSKEESNPKLEFLVSREEMLEKRKKS